ncbi:MAG: hypothetical protein KDE27_22705 [Planctomycetes bacterium]|nr:hypothetical protein [Planctomycetota bacterium]
MPRFPLSALLLACPTFAQTYVVDVNVGPGFDFQQIRGAIPQVPDGATLLVRSGTYAPFQVDGKAITILAEPGATVRLGGLFPEPVQFLNGSPTQRMVLRGIELPWQLVVQNCAGPVHIEDVKIAPDSLQGSASTPYFLAFRCDQLFVRGLENSGTSDVIYSDAVFEDCRLSGRDATTMFSSTYTAAPGLVVTDSDVAIVGCDIDGGAGLLPGTGPALPPSPALLATGARLRLLGPTVATAGAANGAGTAPALGLQYSSPPMDVPTDPQVQLVTAHPTVADPEFQLDVRPLPHATGQSAGVGATLTASAPGPIGQFVILVVGLPGAPILLPGIDNAFWLDPVVSAWAAVGVPQAGAPLSASATIPNSASFRGLIVGWQSLTQGPNGLEASNPAWTLVQ